MLQATSYCATLAGFFEFCGCSPAYTVPALPLGLNADPFAVTECPGVDGKLAQSWFGCPAATGAVGSCTPNTLISADKADAGLPPLELAIAPLATAKQKGENIQPVQGVGDAAYIRNNRDMYAELYSRVGQRVFTAQLDINPGETFASVRPRLMQLGTAMAAKLR